MKNKIRRIALLILLAAAVGLIALRDRPSEDRVPSVAPRRVPAVIQDKPAVAEPVAAKPARVKQPAIARVPVRDDPKQLPAVENSQAVTKGLTPPPELTPVAAVGSDAGKAAGIGAQDEKPADEKPDSLFGWGPWLGVQPAATAGAPTPPQDGVPSVQGHTASAAGTPPAVVVPPPAADSSTRGGHGWGDRNHRHVHRRDR